MAPRDVLYRIHFFETKDRIMRAIWEKGPYDLEGSRVILLQDLASKTLRMRRMLKPLVEAAITKGASHRWGFPFSLSLRRNGRMVVIRTPDQLPDAFALLEIQPIDLPDWVASVIE